MKLSGFQLIRFNCMFNYVTKYGYKKVGLTKNEWTHIQRITNRNGEYYESDRDILNTLYIKALNDVNSVFLTIK